MFGKILIANRGEIACRVIRTARRLGVATVAVYSEADRDALHVAMVDEAHCIGPAPAAESYLRADRIVAAAKAAGAEAVHPGYGFLSENPDFVEACEAAGLTFIGPPAAAIRAMGLKDAAKRLMEEAGVPVVPGYHGEGRDPEFLAERAAEIGWPVLIKARAGGGGKGMRRVDCAEDFPDALASAEREAASSFGDPRVLIEKFVARPRHIEMQVFADGRGNTVHLFERDCSLQRRHQKVIEEAPAPGMTAKMRSAMGSAAVQAAAAVGYEGAGTVEFIADASEGLRPDRFWFMEMNTRLQVEHPVTEAITGTDLVEWQLRVAAGEPLPAQQQEIALAGHAVEARIYAEDAARDFLPATGRLEHLHLPDGAARVDTGVRQGDTITPFYDPMIAKLIVHAPSRAEALGRLAAALAACRASGCVTNLGFLGALAQHPGFVAGEVDTGLIGRDLAALTAMPEPPVRVVAAAALAALGLLTPGAGRDPWQTLAGWRQWSAARQFVTLRRGERLLEVAVVSGTAGHFGVTVGGESRDLRLHSADGVSLRLDLGGRIVGMVVVTAPGAVTIFHEGAGHRFDLPDALAGAEDAGPGGDRILAPLPGVVKLVQAAPGMAVTKGEPLLVMEAMKMEHTLSAPRNGRVAAVLAGAGEQVVEGAVLLELEPADG